STAQRESHDRDDERAEAHDRRVHAFDEVVVRRERDHGPEQREIEDREYVAARPYDGRPLLERGAHEEETHGTEAHPEEVQHEGVAVPPVLLHRYEVDRSAETARERAQHAERMHHAEA